MNLPRKLMAAIATGCLLPACGNFNSSAVRELTAAEIEVLTATQARVTANEADVRSAFGDLADGVEFALRQKHRLGSSIAKAQLLEAMQSPWSRPGMSTTQREVAMYNLFALSEAEQNRLHARLAARRAGVAELEKSYGLLVAAMSVLIAAQEQMLIHLEQPAQTQVSRIIQQVLAESEAFRASLDTGANPRLERLAARAAEAERDIVAVEARIVELLDALEAD